MTSHGNSTLGFGVPWPWFIFAACLAVSLNVQITEVLGLLATPGYLLPVLVAWLANRYGVRVSSVVLCLGLVAVLQPTINLTRTGLGLPGSLRLGVYADVYGLALLSAFALASPRSEPSSDGDGETQREISLWAWLVPLLFSALLEVTYTFSRSEKLNASLNGSLMLALLASAALLGWRGRGKLGPLGGNWPRFGVPIAALVTVAAVVSVDAGNYDSLFRLHFGLQSSLDIVTVLCFLAGTRIRPAGTAFVRVLAIGLVVAIIVCRAWKPAIPLVPTHGDTEAPWKLALEWGRFGLTLVDGLCAVLLGRLLSGFWRERRAHSQRTNQVARILALVLVLQFAIPPLLREGLFGTTSGSTLILGGVCFIAGQVWQGRGLITPLIVQASWLISLWATTDAQQARTVVSLFLELSGLLFCFAFFGILSNRSAHTDELVRNTPRAAATNEP